MHSEHLLFGKILTERKLVTDEQLKQCLQLQAAEIDSGRPRRPLGEILVEVGYLVRAQLDQLLGEERKRLKELTVGPYQILDKLGQGGMGVVYRAAVPDTGVEVALKILPKHYASDPNFLARFHREANLGMEMNHPHIVRTIDFGEHKGTFYLAMEVVEGGTLDHHLHVSGAIPERTALKIVRDLLSALEYAHSKGLIHRDIKPSNVLFDREGRCKLSDFGLAKAQEPDPHFMTEGTTVGTPHYMAPEQARGEALDIRADLYALGATLYHAVTGRTPYSGSSAAVMHSHLRKELPPPRSVNPALSPGCCAIITKLMAKDRNARYRTPEAASEDVARLLRNEPPHAIPAALPVPATRLPGTRLPAAHRAPAVLPAVPLAPARLPPVAPLPLPTPTTPALITPEVPAPASGVVPAPPPLPTRGVAPATIPEATSPSPSPPHPPRGHAAPRGAHHAPAHAAPALRPATTRRRQPPWQSLSLITALLWLAGIVVLLVVIRFLMAGPEKPPATPTPPSAPVH